MIICTYIALMSIGFDGYNVVYVSSTIQYKVSTCTKALCLEHHDKKYGYLFGTDAIKSTHYILQYTVVSFNNVILVVCYNLND